MNCDDRDGTNSTPWRVATVRGEPYDIAGYNLTPVARVLTYAAGRGTLRARSMSGWAAGLVHVRPVAVVAERDGRTRRIALAGRNRGALGTMVAAGAIITLLLWAVRLLIDSGRRQ
ncbi:MAG: hypothetical protein JXA93_03875 [Anaerolineae bacterium]|nr:hypothetical protein [Anaerolineae bacterium]